MVSAMHALTSSFGLGLIGFALLGIVLVEKFHSAEALAAWTEFGWAAIIIAYFQPLMTWLQEQNKDKPLGW